MSRKEKRLLGRILAGLLTFLMVLILDRAGVTERVSWKYFRTALYLIPYLISGYDILLEACRNILHGQVFDENFLMLIATVGAFCIGEYEEASGVMIFFQIGELFEKRAVGKSRASIAELMSIAPERAWVEKEGELRETDPEEVRPEDVIVIRPGERVPLDGVILEGHSFLDTSSITGESVPVEVQPESAVYSGTVNGNGTLRVRVTKEYEDSTVARILELVENASSGKAPVENFITGFAHVYTPVVTLAAVLLAFVPPLFFRQDLAEWVRRACSFLVISCPCALVISVPLSFFGGIGAASRIGVLVKGSGFLQILAETDTLVFDKTGTLTKGVFRVTKVTGGERVLKLAAQMERFSDHPAALAICRAVPEERAESRVTEVTEIPGKGITARVDGILCFAGNGALLREAGIEFGEEEDTGTVVHVAEGGKYLGSVRISDEVKENARETLRKLRETGIRRTVMLSGDRRSVAESLAEELSIDEVRAELLPADKVAEMERLLGAGGGRVTYVGDGVNDAPVLMRSDLGIAMGALGSDAAIEAADIVLMRDDLSTLPKVFRIARKTLRIVRENIVFALSVKFGVLILGALGLASMWLAMFADVGVAVIAILNAMRMLKKERIRKSLPETM